MKDQYHVKKPPAASRSPIKARDERLKSRGTTLVSTARSSLVLTLPLNAGDTDTVPKVEFRVQLLALRAGDLQRSLALPSRCIRCTDGLLFRVSAQRRVHIQQLPARTILSTGSLKVCL